MASDLTRASELTTAVLQAIDAGAASEEFGAIPLPDGRVMLIGGTTQFSLFAFGNEDDFKMKLSENDAVAFDSSTVECTIVRSRGSLRNVVFCTERTKVTMRSCNLPTLLVLASTFFLTHYARAQSVEEVLDKINRLPASERQQRLADVQRLELGELLEVCVDDRREPAQQSGAVARAHVAPRLERAAAARDRGVLAALEVVAGDWLGRR